MDINGSEASINSLVVSCYKCDNASFVMAASLHSYDKSCLKIMTIFVLQHLMSIVVASVKVNCSFMNVTLTIHNSLVFSGSSLRGGSQLSP